MEATTHLPPIKTEYAHIFAMVDVVTSHDRVGIVFDPYSSQCIAADLVVLIVALCPISDDEANILTITNLAVAYSRISTRPTHTHSCPHC